MTSYLLCPHAFACYRSSLLLLFFLMIRRPPRSTLFPYTRSSDLDHAPEKRNLRLPAAQGGVHAPRTRRLAVPGTDRASTRLNSRPGCSSYAIFSFRKFRRALAMGDELELELSLEQVCRAHA